MNFNFFPRNKTFWMYHGSILLIMTLAQTVIILLWREEILFNFVGGLLWLPLFTLATLYYRYLYKNHQWQELNTAKNILVVTSYSLIGGLIVTVIMLGSIIPFFWEDMNKAAAEHKTTASTIITQMLIGNWLQTQLFIGGWIFVYISITTKQRIKEADVTNLKLQNSLKEAQLANLTNQLNPHFLFNTLNNIKFTVRKDPLKSEKMITDLSDILRYSLESSKNEKVQLSDELEIVNRYIAIIKVHMENRLHFESDIPENLYSNFIPPMILQMLIENSIKHGIEKLRYGGKVQLMAEATAHSITFKITNDIPHTEIPTTQSTGIGLRNIEQRLKLLYGNAATISTHGHDQQFIVTLTLPREIR
ncbi:sensor histidine kinase [Cellvibrio fibrivorans]|uniref:Sensor histidine kinase YesM n=2 Tax=Cellvibrio TaxID=10 RepID=A0ABU1UV58_9GAMM|nr:histidine kinase [Cellvibrio fibrivorans]MDR7089085.1 sensor histidine kinase YesM [Cellvibrio fibrivorans]